MTSFWDRVVKGPECWTWTGPHSADGYAKAVVNRKPARAHRVAYELLVGPIPAGLTIDHLCRNRGCLNPAHMEPVTNRENVLRGVSTAAQRARQAECKRGHPLSGTNLHIDARGFRRCRQCQLDWYHQHKVLGTRARDIGRREGQG